MSKPVFNIQGAPAGSNQIAQVEATLQACQDYNAPSLAVAGILYAGIAESGFDQNEVNSSNHAGVFQISAAGQRVHDYHDTYYWAKQWLIPTNDGGVFGAGGGVAYARTHPNASPEEVAAKVEVSGGYNEAVDINAEVNAIMNLYGAGQIKPNAGDGGGASKPSQFSGSVFTVGETTNPYEDYWTAINRLAQEVNWYVYTRLDAPNNVLFLADGTELLSQRPHIHIDRWADKDKLLYIDFTWDNTAFEYKAQHKKKTRTSAKSHIATVASPTECTVHLICNIAGDQAPNPGDVVYLTHCGPGNGPWLIAQVRRSIFKTYSELTLVPGVSPLTSNAPGSNPQNTDITENLNPGNRSQGGGTGSSGPGGPVSTSGYVNPFKDAKGLRPERIDMGVDYWAQAGSPIYAIGDAKIIQAAPGGTGWDSPTNTQAGVYYQLLNGAYKGKYVYVTEDIYPTVVTGQTVKAGDQIAQFLLSSSGLETGWGSGTPYESLASHLGQQKPGQIAGHDPGYYSTGAGISFNNLLTQLGCPSGKLTPNSPASAKAGMPAGYP